MEGVIIPALIPTTPAGDGFVQSSASLKASSAVCSAVMKEDAGLVEPIWGLNVVEYLPRELFLRNKLV